MTKTKSKLNLNPSPTFFADVEIPTRGGNTATVKFQFKHRTKDEFKEFFDSLKPAEVAEGEKAPDAHEDVDVLLDIASGWDLDEPFGAESLKKMAQHYMGSPQAVISAYFAELTGARVKNL